MPTLNYEFPAFNISRDKFRDLDPDKVFDELQEFVEKVKLLHREVVKRVVYGESFVLKVSSSTSTSITPTTSPIILCDASSAAITVNLPKASENNGMVFYIKKTDSSSNTVTIDANASETIDGSTTQIITAQYDCVTVVCDGSNWFIV